MVIIEFQTLVQGEILMIFVASLGRRRNEELRQPTSIRILKSKGLGLNHFCNAMKKNYEKRFFWESGNDAKTFSKNLFCAFSSMLQFEILLLKDILKNVRAGEEKNVLNDIPWFTNSQSRVSSEQPTAGRRMLDCSPFFVMPQVSKQHMSWYELIPLKWREETTEDYFKGLQP